MHINIIIYAVIYKCNNLSLDFCKYAIDQCAESEREGGSVYVARAGEKKNKNEMEMKEINR